MSKAVKVTFVLSLINNASLAVFMYLIMTAKPYEFSDLAGWIGYNLLFIGLPVSIICFIVNLAKRKSTNPVFFMINTLLSATLPCFIVYFLGFQ